MRLRSKILLFSLGTVALLSALAAFLHPLLLPPLVEYRLHRYAQKHWGASLQAKRASRDGSHWVLEDLVFTEASTGKVLLTIDRAEFGYDLHLFGRQLDLHVKVNNPHLTLYSSSSRESTRSKGWPLPTFGLLAALLHTQGDVAIEGGQLLFPDQASVPLAFAFHGGWDKRFHGEGQLQFATDRTVKAAIAPEKNTFYFERADCAVLAALLGSSWIDPALLQVMHGMISGQLAFHHGLLHSDLVLEDLHVLHPRWHLEASYPHLTLHGDAATGVLTLTQPARVTWRKESSHPYQVQQVSGEVSWQPEQPIHFILHGDGETTAYPVQVEGNYERKLQRAEMQLHFANLQGTLHAEVREPDTQLHLMLHGSAADALSLAPPHWKKQLQPIVETGDVHIHATAHYTPDALQLEGNLQLQDDQISFGMDLASTPALSLQKGWLAARKISLQKYLAPQLRQKGIPHVEGNADLYAAFDTKSFVLQYDARNVVLENGFFSIHIPQLETPAIHYFDLVNGTHGGYVPLSSASYLEKNSGLLLTDMCADAFLGQEQLVFKNLETVCQGIYLAGEFTYHQPENALVIHANTMHAKVSQLQQLCSQFQLAPLLLKLPLDGDVSLRPEGSELQFHFLPEGTEIEIRAQGSLSNGSMAFPHQRMTFRDLSLDFDYTLQNQELLFSDLQGMLLIGSPAHVEEYVLAGDRLHFTAGQLDFDVWVGDKNRDIIRAVGATHPDPEDPRMVQWTLDKNLSHFGDVHPTVFELTLKDWSQLERGQLQLDFQLSTLLRDLQRFSRTGFLFLSRHFLTALNDLKEGEGNCQLNLQYDNAQALMSYQLRSHDLKIDRYAFQNCTLSGHLRDKMWRIDQLQLDDLSLAADITPSSDIWQIHFLGVRVGDSLIAGLEGTYDPHNRIFDSKINLLEIRHNPLFTPLASRIPGIVNAKLRANPTFTAGDLALNLDSAVQGAKAMQDFKSSTAESRFNVVPAEEGILVKWERNPAGIQVRAIEGSCAGLDFHLTQSSADTLQGELACTFPQAAFLFSDSLKEAAERWELGGRYQLQGTWGFENRALRFTGHLESRNCMLRGYMWERLTAQVQHTADGTFLQQMALEDPAGKIRIEQADLRYPDAAICTVTMPKLEVFALRPSLLRTADGSPSVVHPVVIESFKLNQFQGNLLDATTLQGEGTMNYATPTGSSPFLWQVTAHLLDQTGLNLAMLTPVEGSFSYRLDQGKIVLTKMRDTYSVDRLSKFYLPKEESFLSTIDFDGNLHLQIRVRPANPLFKFAELFTLNIEGTLSQPHLTLLK